MGMFTVSNVLEQLFTWIYYQILGSMQDFMQYIGNMGAALFDDSYVKGLILFFQMFGVYLFIVGMLIAWFDYAISCDNGRISLQSTLLNILKGMFATSLFAETPITLFRFSVQLESVIGNLFGGLQYIQASETATKKTSFLNEAINIFTNLVNTNPLLNVAGSVGSAFTGNNTGEQHVPTIVNLFFIIAFAYCFFKVLFGNLKRGAILLIQICIGSIFMFSIPRGFMDGFINWCKQVMGTCLIVFLQNIILIMGLQAFRGNIPAGLGLMLGASEVPLLVKMLFGGHDSSVKANVSSIVHTASSAISIGRMFVPA